MDVLEARAQFHDDIRNRKKNIHCPVCDRYAQFYTRYLNAPMALVLILLYRYQKSHPEKEWVHVTSFIIRQTYLTEKTRAAIRGDFTKLRHWKLLVGKAGTLPDGNPSNGYWKITKRGMAFVEKKVKVPAFHTIYNDKVWGSSEDMIDIEQALRTEFSYSKLMGL